VPTQTGSISPFSNFDLIEIRSRILVLNRAYTPTICCWVGGDCMAAKMRDLTFVAGSPSYLAPTGRQSPQLPKLPKHSVLNHHDGTNELPTTQMPRKRNMHHHQILPFKHPKTQGLIEKKEANRERGRGGGGGDYVRT
jgi:hypothetical protein